MPPKKDESRGPASTAADRGPGTAAPSAAGATAAPPASTTAAPASTSTASERVPSGAILMAIGDKLPGYGEGNQKLADAWAAEGINQTTLQERTKAVHPLYTAMIAAWRGDGAQDESFVQQFGSEDPIAVQKFSEITAEQYYEEDLAAARSKFYGKVASAIAGGPTARSRVFPLMSANRFDFINKGRKIDRSVLPQFIHRTHSATGLGDVMSAAGKQRIEDYAIAKLAAQQGVPEATVRAKPDVIQEVALDKATLSALRDGSVQPLHIIDPAKPLVKPGRTTWFSPEQAKVVPAGDTGFSELMVIGALQPEWYPDGTIQVNIDQTKVSPIAAARKPTAFDGLLSALWVSRNQQDQTYGVTGGGAREFLMGNIQWGDVQSAQAQIPSDGFAAELQRLSERFKSAVVQVPQEPGAPTASVATTAGEEMLRGNLRPDGQAGPTYEAVFADSAKEAHQPSTVAGQVAPVGGQAATRGGTFDPARAQAPASVVAGAAAGGAPVASPTAASGAAVAPPAHQLGGPAAAASAAAPAAVPPRDAGSAAAPSANTPSVGGGAMLQPPPPTASVASPPPAPAPAPAAASTAVVAPEAPPPAVSGSPPSTTSLDVSAKPAVGGAAPAAASGAVATPDGAAAAVPPPVEAAPAPETAPDPTDPQQALAQAGNNWFAAKDRWVETNKPLMETLLAYRKQHVDDHVVAVIDEGVQLDKQATEARKQERAAAQAEAARAGRTLPPADSPVVESHTVKDVVIAGSQTLTSDYDVSFVGPGEAWAVTAFNRRFRTQWGKESGSVFDTNVYNAGGYLPPPDLAERSAEEQRTDAIVTAEGQAAYERVEDVLSLVKVAKFIGDEGQWRAFGSGILTSLSGEQKAQAAQNLDRAWQLYQQTQAAVEARKQQVMDEQLAKGVRVDAGNRQQQEELEMTASNLLYEEKLRAVQAAQERRDAYLAARRSAALRGEPLGADDEVQLDLLNVAMRDAQGEALLFANEPYYSQGATMHVVGKLQREKPETPEQQRLKLSAAEVLQSINEQFGDFLKVLGEHSGDAFAVSLIESSKYLYRLLHGVTMARDMMTKAGSGFAVPDTAALMASTQTLLAIRKGEGAWKDKPLADKQTAALSSSGFASAAALSGQVQRIVVAANTAVRSPQKSAPPAAAGTP
jgi:hypothetical protein